MVQGRLATWQTPGSLVIGAGVSIFEFSGIAVIVPGIKAGLVAWWVSRWLLLDFPAKCGSVIGLFNWPYFVLHAKKVTFRMNIIF